MQNCTSAQNCTKILLHQNTFARGVKLHEDTFTRRLFCSRRKIVQNFFTRRVTFPREDNFAQEQKIRKKKLKDKIIKNKKKITDQG